MESEIREGSGERAEKWGNITVKKNKRISL